MQQLLTFEPVLVRNRLGQGMTLRVHSLFLSPDHPCCLIKVSDGAHPSVLEKNIEDIVFQLKERFARDYKNFSMIEIRQVSEDVEEEWYSWRFDWLAGMPIDASSQLLSSQQKNYYHSKSLGFSKVSGGN